MQPVALQSLSELERARLQELALFRLQERLPGGHLSLDRGTGDRRDSMGQEGHDGTRGSCQGMLRLSYSCCSLPAPQPGMMAMERHL